MKIKNKLIVVFLTISIIPLLLMSGIFYLSEKKALREQVTQQLMSIASLQRERIESVLAQNKERFSLVSSRTQLRLSLERYLREGNPADQEQMIRIMRDALRFTKSFVAISIFSLEGKNLASTVDKPYEGKIFFDEKAFVEGQVSIATDTFFINKNKKLTLLLSGPLRLGNTLLGVMFIESDPGNILSSVENYTGLGETGEIILAAQDSEGNAFSLIPTRFDRDAALQLILDNSRKSCPLDQVFQHKSEISVDAVDYRQVPVITAAQYIEPVNWVVLVKIDQVEAELYTHKLETLLVCVLAALFTFICLAAIRLAGNITRPIIRITEAAKQLTKGTFTHCSVAESGDEIGALGQAFNDMTDKLQVAHSELKKNIQQLHLEVDERRKVEDALRNSEEKYRAIYNAPSDAIFVHSGTTGAILDVNRAALEMFGYSLSEILKQDIVSLSAGEAPYDQEHAVRFLQLAMTQGPQLFEWQRKNKKGEIYWAEVALRYTEFGEQVYVIAVVRDIDARKRAENKLAAEQERLAVTLRSIGEGVITTDTDGSIVLINRVAEQLTGWNQEDAAGKSIAEIFHLVDRRSGRHCANPVEEVLKNGKVTMTGLAHHALLIAKDGTRRRIADSGAPIRDEQSRVVGVVLVFRDVTEEHRKEEELVRGRKLESVGLLAGGIAHDFNNILAAILGNINLALLYSKPEDKIHVLLQDAEKAALRARNLTRQLLTFARGGDPVKELSLVRDIIKDSANFVLRGSNVRCNFCCQDDLWPVEIDQGQVGQVIQNIIINANQAMPEGGVIEVACTNIDRDQCDALRLAPRDYIKITIQDNGIGIANSLVEKIFDPYFTTKQQGNGLGLAVSHSIISKHDGYITADSEQGKGTTFTIYLPAEKNRKVRPVVEDGIEIEVHGQGRVMIMDDEEMVRTVSRGMLNHLGYDDVLEARNGEEAIALFKEAQSRTESVDLIIMDLTIPGGMGGQEAVTEIHKLDPAARVIVSSGYSNDPVMANYKAFGFQAAIIKPFQISELQKIMQRFM